MDSQNSKNVKRLTANNRCKTINPALKFSSQKKNSISKEKKKRTTKNRRTKNKNKFNN